MLCNHPPPHFYWVDESNAAITNAAQPMCRTCYTTRYGTPRDYLPPREEDLYRQNNGVLGVHNLLASGDFAHRDQARARFRIEWRDA